MSTPLDPLRTVYRERAALVAFLASVHPSQLGEDPREPDYVVVYVDTPEGQMGWHIHRDDLDLFPHVPTGTPRWDGHSTAEKYYRLARLTAGVAVIFRPPGTPPLPHSRRT